jgi:hypothetical protein
MALTKVRTGGITDDAVDVDKLYTPNLGRRNIIINGAMQVAQRGTGAATADNGFPVDRWKLSNSDSADVSAQQSTDTPTGEGFRNSIKWSVGTGSNTVGSQAIRTSLEVQDSTDVLAWGSSGGKTATLSFWIKASQSGTITTSLRESGASACFLDLTTVTTTWVKKSINIPAPTFGSWSTTANAGGVVAIFSFDQHTSASGSTANSWVAANHISLTTQTEWVSIDGAEIYITGVQLEANSQSTPFEHRSFGEELGLCQRYFQDLNFNSQGYPPTSGYFHCQVTFPTAMRATPTGSITDGSKSGTSGSATIATSISESACRVENQTSGNNTRAYHVNGVLKLDAEL